MPITPEIQALVNRLNQELNQTEQEATEGLNIVRPLLSRFPENDRLNQFFAYFSSVLFFVEASQTRRIQNIVESISDADVTEAEIQEPGEDLSTLLGRVLEVKIEVRLIITRWEK
ncbi:MAG: hypothetical protein EBE86_023755 [Hormoscilla sp. GUM202]|nr:hypothetical protein [Hormoscilla sp. GUM202]